MSARRFGLGLAVVFVAALALRLAAAQRFVGLSSPPDLYAQPDQRDYEEAAFHLANGDGYALAAGPTYLRAPGTSAAIAIAYAVAGRSYLAARVWFCALSALTCVALGLLAARLFDRSTGLVAAAWLALTPAHWYYALHLVSELPYALTITVAVLVSLLAWRSERPSMRVCAALGAGALYAIAALVRPQAVFALPCAWLLALAARSGKRRRVAAVVAAATVSFLAITGGWVARNARVVGHPTFAALGPLTLWGSNNPRAIDDPALCGGWVTTGQLLADAGVARPIGEAELAALARRQAVAFLRTHLAQLPRLEVCKLRRLGEVFLDTPNESARAAFAAAWLFTAPLALAGLLIAWRRDRAGAACGVLPLLALLLATLVFYGSTRFRHSTEPLLVLFAAGGSTALLRRTASE